MTRNLLNKTSLALALLLAFCAVAAGPARSQSREQLEKWIARLVSLRNDQCKDEDRKKVRGRIDYAATLLAHSEVEEAENSLAEAAAKAAGEPCRKAIEANGKLSTVD